MTRQRKVGQERKVIYVNQEVLAQIDLFLFSNLEGKVPFGAVSQFFEEAAREKLDRLRSLNIQVATTSEQS